MLLKKLSFIFPVRNKTMGGVQNLIIRLIRYYVENKMKEIRLYDYSDGLIHLELDKFLPPDSYEFICLDDMNVIINNLGNETLILTNSTLLYYPLILKNKNILLLVWDVYYPFWDYFYRLCHIPIFFFKQNIMKILTENRAIIFMEEAGREKFINSGYDVSHMNIIHIPVDNIAYKYKRTSNSRVRLGYIGRAVFWKIMPIVKLLTDLSNCSDTYSLTIFTNDKSPYEKYITKPSNVCVDFEENVTGNDLDNLLLQIDIGFWDGYIRFRVC